jgi:hypothetical protein
MEHWYERSLGLHGRLARNALKSRKTRSRQPLPASPVGRLRQEPDLVHPDLSELVDLPRKTLMTRKKRCHLHGRGRTREPSDLLQGSELEALATGPHRDCLDRTLAITEHEPVAIAHPAHPEMVRKARVDPQILQALEDHKGVEALH